MSGAGSCFKLHGKNIVLSDDGRSAERTASYNHGVVISQSPLRPGHIFRVCHHFSYNHGVVISQSPLRPGHIFRVCHNFTLSLHSTIVIPVSGVVGSLNCYTLWLERNSLQHSVCNFVKY